MLLIPLTLKQGWGDFYTVEAVVHCVAVTATTSRLCKIIFESFAGYGLQESGSYFGTKTLSFGVARQRTLCSAYDTAISLLSNEKDV